MNKRDFYAREIGCIVCRVYLSVPAEPADIHHPAPGRKRISDNVYIPLCPWHHRGVVRTGWTTKQCEELLGPSLARNKKEFINQYGDEMYLIEVTEQIAEAMTGGSSGV